MGIPASDVLAVLPHRVIEPLSSNASRMAKRLSKFARRNQADFGSIHRAVASNGKSSVDSPDCVSDERVEMSD
jgi:hypothetical protein